MSASPQSGRSGTGYSSLPNVIQHNVIKSHTCRCIFCPKILPRSKSPRVLLCIWTEICTLPIQAMAPWDSLAGGLADVCRYVIIQRSEWHDSNDPSDIYRLFGPLPDRRHRWHSDAQIEPVSRRMGYDGGENKFRERLG